MRAVGRVLSWLVSAVLLLLAATGGRAGRPVSAGGQGAGNANEVRIFTYRFPASIDPAGYGDPWATAQVLERLTDIDGSSNVVPALAESWAIDPGARRIVFTLRPGLRFSDGSPLTAPDVVRSWMRLLDPDLQSPSAWLLSDVEGAVAHRLRGNASVGIVATDPLHVEVRLARAANDFPAIAATPWLGVVPPTVTQSLLRNDAIHMAASGPFRVESWATDDLVLAANPHYWAGPPAIDRVRVLGAVSDRGPAGAFQEDQVDYTQVASADAAWIASDPELGPQLIVQPSPSVVIYGFAATRPPFVDPRVRRAFAEAVDWKRMVGLSNFPAVPATGMVPPGVPGRSETDFSPRYDPAEARSLLAEAGYPGGSGFPTVTFSSSGFAWDQFVVAAWASELGVSVRAEEGFDVDHLGRLQRDPPSIWADYWTIDYPAPNDFLGVLAGVGQENNFSRWSSRDFEDAIQAARGAANPDASKASFERAQAILRDEVPLFAAAYAAPSWALARAGLAGEGANGMGLVRLAALSWTSP